MGNKMVINKYENYKNKAKIKKDENVIPMRREQYEQDLEKIVRRDKDANEAILWGFVLGFLLFIILFVCIIVFTI